MDCFIFHSSLFYAMASNPRVQGFGRKITESFITCIKAKGYKFCVEWRTGYRASKCSSEKRPLKHSFERRQYTKNMVLLRRMCFCDARPTPLHSILYGFLVLFTSSKPKLSGTLS